MAIKQRFSIATLLILVTLVAAVTVIWLDRIELSRTREILAKRNFELGHIDTQDFATNEGAIRHVPIEGADTWKYRLYLPPNHSYSIEYFVGDLEKPKHYSIEPLSVSGQFSIVVHQAIDLYKPNYIPRECFVTSIIDDTNEAKLRFGTTWNPEDTRSFRNYQGHYTNVAGPNHRELHRFQVGDSIDLFRAAHSSKDPAGETLRIRLVKK